MTEIKSVAEAVLYVDDLPAATNFYREVLGLPLTLSNSVELIDDRHYPAVWRTVT